MRLKIKDVLIEDAYMPDKLFNALMVDSGLFPLTSGCEVIQETRCRNERATIYNKYYDSAAWTGAQFWKPLTMKGWDDKLFMEHLANNSFNPKKLWYKRWWNWSLIKLGIKEKPMSLISFNTNQEGVSVDDTGKISIKLRKEPD